jgi:Zn-dependent peptidase ImmA (M78 family)/DNA-binding XRE family transcriptional regulator
MSLAFISPSVLKWARLRSQLNIEFVAEKVPVKAEKLTEWEAGQTMPTFLQAQKLASILHIPFGYLFLKEPPVERFELPDLRTVDDKGHSDFSVDLRDIISDVLFRQDWYREFRKEQGYTDIPFIGKYNYAIDTSIIVDEITNVFKLTIEDRKGLRNWEEFFQLLVKRAESIGLWVMRSSMVGNNTHRLLNTDEFRGFVISDTIAPAIFINGTDAKAAQIFTLIHEVVHLWFGSSGVSNIDFRKDLNAMQDEREKKCNEIAAEILVPKLMIQELWNEKVTLAENAEGLSKFFKVSSVVVARRALELKLILPEDFFSYYRILVDRWREQRLKMKESDGGPSYYVNIPIKNGVNFSTDVLNSVYSQKILMRDGARLLGLNPTTLEGFAKEVGIRS